MTMPATIAPRSLRWRLLAATIVGLALALVLAWWALAGLFREHIQRQFEGNLAQQLDQLTARLAFDPNGQPGIDPQGLSDPRWQQPFSGLYWQIDALGEDQGKGLRQAILRSRSLWDTQLHLSADALADGKVHVHQARGPRDSRVLLLERTVRAEETGAARWRLVVAGDMTALVEAQENFRQALAVSLGILLVLLAAAAWGQVTVGLWPLGKLRRSLREIQEARVDRLTGKFPSEVQPLVDDFNYVLDHNQQMVERARTQAGNLAHALKTPLTVLTQLAAQAPAGSEWATTVQDQVALARRHIDWHLAQARLAAGPRHGQRCDVATVLQGLVRTMRRLHADRALAFTLDLPPTPLAFAGEAQDLQEMLGNLLDNACKWARSQVRISARRIPGDMPRRLEIVVEDDGPGIAPRQLESVLERGVRLDESVPGSGLGLAIVQDGVRLNAGELVLGAGTLGGLRAEVRLPAAADCRVAQ